MLINMKSSSKKCIPIDMKMESKLSAGKKINRPRRKHLESQRDVFLLCIFCVIFIIYVHMPPVPAQQEIIEASEPSTTINSDQHYNDSYTVHLEDKNISYNVVWDDKYLGTPIYTVTRRLNNNTAYVSQDFGYVNEYNLLSDAGHDHYTENTNKHDPGKMGLNMSSLEDFFKYLKTPQGLCRRLFRVGGKLCHGKLDGHKLVCADAGVRPPRSCLLYSYGVNHDISFDRAMGSFGCQVHMFDITSFGHKLPPSLVFHRLGVHDFPAFVQFPSHNTTLEMDTIGGHMRRLGHLGKDLHMLKIDVENAEWRVLAELVKSPLLDYIGQLSLEIHADDLRFDPNSSIKIKERWSILLSLEARGWKRVAYWDNPQLSNELKRRDGSILYTCGETLYINTNWTGHERRLSLSALQEFYNKNTKPKIIQGEIRGELPSFVLDLQAT